MSRLAGKVALITGASSGLGRVGAERFAAEGASVVIADVVDGDDAVEAIAAAGGEASFVRCDVTDPASVGDLPSVAARLDSFDTVTESLRREAMIVSKFLHPNIVPYQVFNVADGYIIIATGNDSQYQKLCGVLGAPEMAKDPAYIDNKSRLANRAELIGKLTALTMKFKMRDLAEKLDALGVPAGPINNLDQVFDDPHVKHRGMKLNLPSALAKDGTIPGIRTPMKQCVGVMCVCVVVLPSV